MIPVLASNGLRAWPGHDHGGGARYLAIENALTTAWPTDAHFAAYRAPELPRRLDSGAPARLGGVAMVLFVVDVDCAEAHREGGATPDAWRVEQRVRIAALRADHPEFFAYETRGGLRLVVRLATPYIVEGERGGESAQGWRRWYVRRLGYLVRRYGIEGDPSCCDWTRLHRLPRATRDEGGDPEARPTHGPSAPGTWSYVPTADDDAADLDAVRVLAARNASSRWAAVARYFESPAPPRGPELPLDGVERSGVPARGDDTKRARAYFDAALPELLREIVDAPDKNQNNIIRDNSLRAFRLALAAGASPDVVGAQIADAARAGKHPASRAAGTIASSRAAAMREGPATLPPPVFRVRHSKWKPVANARAGAAQAPAPTDTTDAVPPPFTDLGNAERLVRAHGDDLRYCPGLGGWLTWSARGDAWQRDESGEVMRRAKTVPRALYRNAADIDDPGMRVAAAGWARKSEGRDRLRAMIDLAASEPGVYVNASSLDADPWAFNCRNGTLDLRRGELRKHRREDLCTKVAPVDYDAAAKCPVFDAFFARVQPDAEVRACLLRVLGYALTGAIREHVLPIHHGSGRNGKGTLRDAVMGVMGEYATEVPSSLLMAKGHDAHPTEKMVLRGARFASASETGKGRAIDEALVKLLTGGDPITARYMGKDFVTFPPTHKLWLSTNHRPVIRELSPAMWGRLLLFQWSVFIPPDEQDTRLAEKLAAERSGILRRLVEGCLDWQVRGIAPPVAVRAATESYRADSDPLGDFLAQRTTTEKLSGAKMARAMARELLEAYTRWASENGAELMTSKVLGEALGDRFTRRRLGGMISYVGVRLLTDAELDELKGEDGENGEDGEDFSDRCANAGSRRNPTGAFSPFSPSSPEDGRGAL